MYKKKKGKRKNTWKNSCRSSKSNVITRYKILIVNDIEFMTFPRVVLGITWRVNEEYPFSRSFFFFSFFLFFFFFPLNALSSNKLSFFPFLLLCSSSREQPLAHDLPCDYDITQFFEMTPRLIFGQKPDEYHYF